MVTGQPGADLDMIPLNEEFQLESSHLVSATFTHSRQKNERVDNLVG
jgi:hypothetical protein